MKFRMKEGWILLFAIFLIVIYFILAVAEVNSSI